MKLGQDWMWIGIGAAVIIGAGSLAKPVYEIGENIRGATDVINPNWWITQGKAAAGAVKGWGDPERWWT